MAQIIIAILTLAVSMAVLFIVVRKATRADEQVELLRQLRAGDKLQVPVDDSDDLLRAEFERNWIRCRMHLVYGSDSAEKAAAWDDWRKAANN